MKNFTLLALSVSYILFFLRSCKDPSEEKSANLPRVAICGLAIEASQFSPARSNEASFKARYEKDVFKRYPFFHPDSGVVNRAHWLPALQGHALPGGVVTKEAYESLVGKTLDLLKVAMPFDGLFFDIHGAMSVEDMDDPEGDFITKIRELIGNDVLISTSTDLHGSVSKVLAKNTDMITTYRMAPHEDAAISRKRALVNLLNRLENGKGKPKYKAWIKVPILLPGEQTSTRIEPGKSLYAEVPTVINDDKVIDAGIWMSYPWSDLPRNHGLVMAYGDDKEAVRQSAEKLARHFWDVRKEFDFVAPTTSFEESISKALASKVKPYFISDMGDNPTAGGAGDVTWTLHEIMKYPEFEIGTGKTLIYASIPGPELVKKAKEVGVGGMIDVEAGAKVDHRFGGPIRLKGKVAAIKEGDPDAGTEVVVQNGNTNVIVTAKRKPYHHEKDFTDLGLDPRNAGIVIVKIGYLEPELYDMQKDWTMALTPGGVDQDLFRLPYHKIERPIFPLDPDMPDPDLTAQFIPLAGEN